MSNIFSKKYDTLIQKGQVAMNFKPHSSFIALCEKAQIF